MTDPRDDPIGAEERSLSQLAMRLLSRQVTQTNEQSFVNKVSVLRPGVLVVPLLLFHSGVLCSTTGTKVH